MTTIGGIDLICVVSASDSMVAAAEAQDRDIRNPILERWAMNNRARGLTGAVMSCDGCLVHILEGTNDAVRAMLAIVATDRRHTNLRVLYDRPCVRRRFGGWPLVYVGPSLWLRRALANRALGELTANSDSAAKFLIDLILGFVGDGPEPAPAAVLLAAIAA